MPARTSPSDAASPNAVTKLILQIFKLNGRLLLAGDQLVEPLGLTSARWQVLGSIASADQPQPVVRLARDMGVSRQAVQRIINELERESVVAFQANPRHKRAQLVAFTDHGRTLYEEAQKLQGPWVTGLADSVTQAQVEIVFDVLGLLLMRLDAQNVSVGDVTDSLQ